MKSFIAGSNKLIVYIRLKITMQEILFNDLIHLMKNSLANYACLW